MAKITFSKITNANTLSVINDNFTKIQQEMQDRIAYRDNPPEEPNTFKNDLDVNDNDVYNIDTLSAKKVFLDGVSLNNALSGGTFDYSEEAAASAAAAALSEAASAASSLAAQVAANSVDLVSITKYGASPSNGATVNKAAVDAAVAANPNTGVRVPAGLYSVSDGPLGASGSVLRLEKGASFTSPGGVGALSIPVGGGMIAYNEGADKDVWYWGRKMSGTHAVGTGAFDNGFSPAAYMFDVRSDSVDAQGTFMKSVHSRLIFGGSTSKGGRLGVYGVVEHTDGATASDNNNRNYVGVAGSSYAHSADGGTAGNEKGGYFGGGFAAYADNTTQYAYDVAGAEFNTFIGVNSGTNKFISTISVIGAQAQRGTQIDCGIRMAGQSGISAEYTGHIGWSTGMLWTDANGADPVAATGSLMASRWFTGAPRRTVARGFDLSGFDITNEVLASGPYMKLTNDHLLLADLAGFATIEPNGPSVNSNLILRGRGTGLVGIGNKTNTGDVAITGYITVCDSSGNPVKIATVA